MIRFHGLLAPHAKLRAEIVPSPPSGAAEPAASVCGQQLELFEPPHAALYRRATERVARPPSQRRRSRAS
jgi:hypothetical protein